MKISCSESLTTYHPYAISHAPLEERDAGTLSELGAAVRGAFHTIAIATLEMFSPLPGIRGDPALLEALGRHFGAIGAMAPSDFVHLMRSISNKLNAQRVAALEHHLVHDTASMPAAYREDVRAMIEIVLAAIEQGAELPQELPSGRTPDETVARAQRQFVAYGELCTAWPAMVAASRALKADGAGLGERS